MRLMRRWLLAAALLITSLLAACSKTLAPSPAVEVAPQNITGGVIMGWGSNSFGQLNVPTLPPGMTYTAVAAGDSHSVGLRSDGTVDVWGDDEQNVPALPPGLTYTAVAAGDYHSLGLRSDGIAIAWGFGQPSTLAPPKGTNYTAVARGAHHNLVLTDRVPKTTQIVSFTSTPPEDARVGGSYTPSATASSGLSVTFSTSTPGTCAFTAGTFSFIAEGTCTITADQTGDDAYHAAPQATQDITVSAVPPPPAGTYTVDLGTAPLNRLVWNVRVGRGVSYEGDSLPNKSIIRVDGQRFIGGKRKVGHQVKVLNLYGSKRLALVKVGTNIPYPHGGVIKLKPHAGFNGPSNGRNGLLTLKSITVSNITVPGAQLTLYGDGAFIKRMPLAQTGAGQSVTIPLDEPGVGFVQVSARSAFAVDDVVFEDRGSLR